MPIPFAKVTIIGVGLIGGSIAAAIKAVDPAVQVYGVGRTQQTLDEAMASGVLDAACTGDESQWREWFKPGGSDLIIVATPVFAAEEWFQRIEDCGFDGIITDVASTKAVICEIAERVLSNPTRFLPGHPMAGSEVNGFGGARADLFQGAYWILCPAEDTCDDIFVRMHELASALGARVISIDRTQHDNAVAIVSHVPHMVASSLVQLAGNHADERKELLRLAAGGFKDSTRIAAGSPELWAGIAMDNSAALCEGLHEMREILGKFEDAVRNGDVEALKKLLSTSAELRRSLPAKWIPDSSKLVELRIPMTDRPGIIAEVTSAAAHAGCNIQSIDIDHINESTAVLELILTDEGDMGRLGGELINGGFDFNIRNLGGN